MKVKCIKTSGYFLTVGKIYNVEPYINKIFGEEYYIINDVGTEHTVEKYLFIDVDTLRNKKLERLGI